MSDKNITKEEEQEISGGLFPNIGNPANDLAAEEFEKMRVAAVEPKCPDISAFSVQPKKPRKLK